MRLSGTRQSIITGQMRARHWLNGEVPIFLYDDAEPVPVADPMDPWAAVSFMTVVNGRGQIWYTLCYCGPAAPLPAVASAPNASGGEPQ